MTTADPGEYDPEFLRQDCQPHGREYQPIIWLIYEKKHKMNKIGPGASP